MPLRRQGGCDEKIFGQRLGRVSRNAQARIRRLHNLLKSCFKTQPVVATSSGEVELYAASKCAADLMGIHSLMHDLGVSINIEMGVDAIANIGTMHRRGIDD